MNSEPFACVLRPSLSPHLMPLECGGFFAADPPFLERGAVDGRAIGLAVVLQRPGASAPATHETGSVRRSFLRKGAVKDEILPQRCALSVCHQLPVLVSELRHVG